MLKGLVSGVDMHGGADSYCETQDSEGPYVVKRMYHEAMISVYRKLIIHRFPLPAVDAEILLYLCPSRRVQDICYPDN